MTCVHGELNYVYRRLRNVENINSDGLFYRLGRFVVLWVTQVRHGVLLSQTQTKHTKTVENADGR